MDLFISWSGKKSGAAAEISNQAWNSYRKMCPQQIHDAQIENCLRRYWNFSEIRVEGFSGYLTTTNSNSKKIRRPL